MNETRDVAANKELWFEVGPHTTTSTLDKVFNLPYDAIVVPADLLPKIESVTLPQRVQLAVVCDDVDPQAELLSRSALRQKLKYVFTRRPEHLEAWSSRLGVTVGLWSSVDDRQSLDRAADLAARGGVLVVQFADPTNIPLELVLARAEPRGTRVLKKVATAEDGEVSLLTMEKGSDGIVLRSDEIDEIVRLGGAREQAMTVQYTFEDAVVTRVQHAGMGDRVCIDTTSELFPDEGMLLGSTSSGGLMVCSETHYLPYMNLRPFRVNAGALHLYVWGPDQRAVYLSDLRAGDQVLVFDDKGRGRPVTIGRLKIERRPLLLVQATVRDTPVNVFVQDDWHVRLFGAGAEIRPSSEIRPGDRLLGYVDQPGRHVGLRIRETIKEL
ncbi:uncharacterized protein SOCE26_095690 [Sorangium cellulosum]|uniref:3-dehydroquinate synthase n=1 Tax=Sorangium cellulosum TaxID=56 RepID=A0A2L0F927_SORCE|nr:3-dehydroquinate synthase II [Sorangium cellulosum]AUX48043.1 uncharacterized protein SOCE26_095690 [Sorangium cellulosum]